MFTKLDMIYNQLVLTNYFEFRHGDVISDVTADQFRLDFCIFRTCGYNNFKSLHLMFTNFDMIYNQLVLTNLKDWRHDDVIVTFDRFWL